MSHPECENCGRLREPEDIALEDSLCQSCREVAAEIAADREAMARDAQEAASDDKVWDSLCRGDVRELARFFAPVKSSYEEIWNENP